ncbi:hypothetical protein KVR01_002957 [Diaporthe batatas]|uniref:uncharacterized protein n=1 Tax=Diaporthe batatas TaxID=748121 RepID=UPI001D04A224|nr:uncharacterized protein KVR01_002957 [Diaporthe batatas]KAG8167268.1 hypothetical protein KVR01_002957 [Diaporthe batatas]
MRFLLLLSNTIVSAAIGLSATTTTLFLNSQEASLLSQRSTNDTDTAPLVIRGDTMEVGSPCPELEGEWNCMVTSFQRCASGRWSIVLNTAHGTVCEPEGFSHDFQPAFASWYPPTDTTEAIVCTATVTAPSVSTDTTRPGGSIGASPSDAAPHPVVWAVVFGLGSMALLFLAM